MDLKKCLSRKHDVVVRYDPNCIVIWSLKNDCYYVPINSEIESKIKTVLNRKISSLSLYDGLNDSLVKDLKFLGFDGSIREIHTNVQMPFDVYFDFTWKCNLACSYCYNREVDRCVTMNPSKVRHIFHEMWKNGIMRVHVAGGEPFLDPEGFKNYIKTAYNYGIGNSVTCNGTMITEPLCELVFGRGVKSLTFSLDGDNARIHDSIRGAGAFDKLVSGIKCAVSIKRKTNVSTIIQTRTAWTPKTRFDDIEKIIQFAIDLGIDIAQFHSPERCEFHPRRYYGESENVEGYYNALFFMREMQKKYAEKIDIWHTLNPLVGCGKIGIVGNQGCIGGQELLAIQPTGEIAPCLMNLHSFGNLFSDWNGDLNKFFTESSKLRDFHKIVRKKDPACQDCDFYPYCRGGSRVRVKVQYGYDNSRRDPFCPKDYQKKHPEIKANLKPSKNINYFEPLAIVHSL